MSGRDPGRGGASGGERDGDRAVMERNTRDLVESGVRPEKAREMARQSMIRVDRKMRDEGKR